MELHARTRRDLEPDPEFDPICALFYCLSSDAPLPDVDSTQLTGAIVVDKDHRSCDQGERLLSHNTTKIKDNCSKMFAIMCNIIQQSLSKSTLLLKVT